MKRRINISLAIMLLVFLLTACGDAIPDLSDDEMKMVEEYAAQLLLKYDKNHSTEILTEDAKQAELDAMESKAKIALEIKAKKEAEEKAKEENSKENNKDGSKGNSSETAESSEPVYQDIAEFLELNGIAIDYSNYVVGDSYPVETQENDWQGIATAGPGNKLVAFEFTVKNNNAEDYNLDMGAMKIKASVKVNDLMTKSPLTTLLMNDFMFYRGTIPAGQSENLVLLIELSENDAQTISSALLTVKKDDRKMQTTLL